MHQGLASPAPKSRNLTAGSRNLFKKSAELARILPAGAGLDAARHINRIGTDNADGFADIFRCKSAGEDDSLRLGNGTGSVPIAGDAGAAIVAGDRRIQKKGAGSPKSRELRSGASLPDAQCLDDRQVAGEALDHLGRLIAVELRRAKSNCPGEREDRLFGPVYEDTDWSHERRETPDQLRRGGRREAPRTLRIEVEADGMRPKFSSELRVVELGDATDLHSDHEGLCPGRRRNEKGLEGRTGIRGGHEVFADEEGVETCVSQIKKVGVRTES